MLTQALLHCLYLTKVETHDGANYQLMLHLPKKLSSLSANEKISQLLPELESGWSPLVGLNWKPKISLFCVKNSKMKLKWVLK